MEQEFRPVSALACVSILAGIAAWIGWASVPLLYFSFGLALLTGIAVLQLWRERDHRTGLSASLVGLALAVLACLSAGAFHAYGSWLIEQEARQVADAWIDNVLANELDQALIQSVSPLTRHGLTESKILRVARYADFVASPAVRQFTARGDEAEITCLGVKQTLTRYVSGQGRVWQVDVRYRVRLEGIDHATTLWLEGWSAPSNEWPGRQWVVKGSEVLQRSEGQGLRPFEGTP